MSSSERITVPSFDTGVPHLSDTREVRWAIPSLYPGVEHGPLTAFHAMCVLAESLAQHPAGTCDGCGNDAVELCTWLEDDGGPRGVRLSYCRPCMGDEADDPSNEWITGEAIS